MEGRRTRSQLRGPRRTLFHQLARDSQDHLPQPRDAKPTGAARALGRTQGVPGAQHSPSTPGGVLPGRPQCSTLGRTHLPRRAPHTRFHLRAGGAGGIGGSQAPRFPSPARTPSRDPGTGAAHLPSFRRRSPPLALLRCLLLSSRLLHPLALALTLISGGGVPGPRATPPNARRGSPRAGEGGCGVKRRFPREAWDGFPVWLNPGCVGTQEGLWGTSRALPQRPACPTRVRGAALPEGSSLG